MIGLYVRRYRARRAAGQCVDCGREPVSGRVRCQHCVKRKRRQQRSWRVAHRPRMTQAEREMSQIRRQRAFLERRFGPMVDAMLQGGTVTRSKILALLYSAEYSGYQRGYMAVWRRKQAQKPEQAA